MFVCIVDSNHNTSEAELFFSSSTIQILCCQIIEKKYCISTYKQTRFFI